MINENNYETYFMSLIDNELNAAERAAVEAFVLTDSKYAEELAIFEKTKIQVLIASIYPLDFVLLRKILKLGINDCKQIQQ